MPVFRFTLIYRVYKKGGPFEVAAIQIGSNLLYINLTAQNASNEKHKFLDTREINNNVLKFASV